jgi:hypothetical protein
MEKPYSPRRKADVIKEEGRMTLCPFSRKNAASPISRVNRNTRVAIHQRRCLRVSRSLSMTGVKALVIKRNILGAV